MIERMKIVQIVAAAPQKTMLLDGLRELGVVHFAEKRSADKPCLERLALLSSTAAALEEYAFGEPEQSLLSDEAFERLYRETSAALERIRELELARSFAISEADRVREWGDFAPAELADLKKENIDLHFYCLDKTTMKHVSADPDVFYVRLSPIGKMETIAVLGTLPARYSANEFQSPEKGLSDLELEIATRTQEIEDCKRALEATARHIPSFRGRILQAQNDVEYSSVNNTSEGSDGLVWLSGYIPVSEIKAFQGAAAKNGWAWAMEDPAEDDDRVPTKVRYSKVTRLMIPVFDILGTVPAYREYDISFWFLGFFSLVFAMIIGDTGYGFLFLLCAAVLTVMDKRAGKSVGNPALLLWVLSIATIIWGALTGTWFGLEQAMHVPLLKSLVIPSFANYPAYFDVTTTQQQNSIMKFCFILGTVQLSLACVINILRKLKQKDLSWLADLGWLCAICALYFVVLYLVIGAQIDFVPIAIIVAVGFLLVVFFGGMAPDKTFAQGLKSGVGDAFTVFLNTISAFGNIMSYIRLFAVGMASLAIAQSFNDMALGFQGPLIIVGIFIMVIGHGLNIVMGLLSVVVHGVRLNLLEFSGQLGMEWAGIAYSPFRKLKKIKK